MMHSIDTMIVPAHTGAGTTEERRQVLRMIRNGSITMAGHKRLKIYGTLHCASGKRMKPSNRVFFRDEAEALTQGYRPCGHCCRAAYQQWKRS